MGRLFFYEESIYEFSKPYLKFVMNGRTDGSTDRSTEEPKAICPFTFFKVGYIIKGCTYKITNISAALCPIVSNLVPNQSLDILLLP